MFAKFGPSVGISPVVFPSAPPIFTPKGCRAEDVGAKPTSLSLKELGLIGRVGSAAQLKGMKSVSGSLKSEMAQYASLSTFAQFGTDDLDAVTKVYKSMLERLLSK